MPNHDEGVAVNGSDGNVIGGTSASDRNVISGNRLRGVLFFNGAQNNVVRGNYIGTNADGSQAVPNEVGVYTFHSPNNWIGGASAGAGNLVSGNAIFGVYLLGSGSTGNVVQGNSIGVDAAGNPSLGNGRMGVDVNGGIGNTIGGSAPGAGNVIAGNQEDGVRIFYGSNNTIRSNTIYANAGPGINLSGGNAVSPNDGLVGSGPNGGMDYPVLTAAVVDGGNLHVEGYVGTLAQPIPGVHLIELFQADNAPADQDGEVEVGDGLSLAHGEGRWPLGTCSSLSDGSFACDLSIPAAASLVAGDSVTATATHSGGSTSEFGANFKTTAP
jgi:parallel beta-helix repeat protein